MSLPFPSYPHYPSTPYDAGITNDLDCHVTSWAIKPQHWKTPQYGELVYASFIGRHMIVRATWAALRDGKKTSISLRYVDEHGSLQHANAWRPEGKGIYHAFWNDAPLPKAGSYAHLVMLHRSALQPTTLQGFVHLSMDNKQPHFGRFFSQLDRALTLPLSEEWAPLLWEQGSKRKVIQPLTTHNCKGWWVDPNEKVWADITTRLHAGSSAVLRVETYGVPDKTQSDVAEAASEEDDE